MLNQDDSINKTDALSSLSESGLRQLMVKLEAVAQEEGYREEPKTLRIPSTIQAEIDAKLNEADYQILLDRLLLGYGFDVSEYGAIGNGSTDDAAAITTTATAAAGRTLIFPAGTYKVSSNLTLDETVVFADGAMLSIDSGVTVTFAGMLKAGLYQIFSGAGDASLAAGSCEYVLPQWWGAVGDDSTDNATALNAALAAAATAGMLYISAGIYQLSTPLTGFPANSNARHATGPKIRGAGMEDTILKYTGTSGYCIEVNISPEDNNDSPSYVHISDLQIQTPNITATSFDPKTDDSGGGVMFASASFCELERIAFANLDQTYATAIYLRQRNIDRDEASFTHDTDRDFTTTGAGASEKYAIKFTGPATNNSFVKSVTVTLKRTGSPAGTINAAIYDDSGGSVGAQTGNDSETVNCNTLSAAAAGATVKFEFDYLSTDGRPKLDSGVSASYWLVLETTGYTYSDGVTEVILKTDAGAGGANTFGTYNAGGPSWSTSNDGSNYEVDCRYGQSLLNYYRNIQAYSGTGDKAKYAIRVVDNSQAFVQDSSFYTVSGAYGYGGTILRVRYSQLSCVAGNRPIEYYGSRSSFECNYIEGSQVATPSYFDGGVYHLLADNRISYVDWSAGTRLILDNNYGPLLLGDDATLIPQPEFQHKIVTPDTDHLVSATGTTTDGGATSLASTVWYCPDKYDKVALWFGPTLSKGHTLFPRGAYLFTVYARSSNTPAADDLQIITREDDASGTIIADEHYSLTTTYEAFHQLVIWESASVGERLYFNVRSKNAASDIYVSHVEIRYICPDVPTQHDINAFNTVASDADGARKSRMAFIGRQSGNEQSYLASITALHHGAADDEKGQLEIAVNDGNDAFVPSKVAVKIISDGGVFMAELKSGANQGAAGAAADELWIDTADQTIKVGT